MEGAQLWESGNLDSGPNLAQIICVTLTMYFDFSLFCFVFLSVKWKPFPMKDLRKCIGWIHMSVSQELIKHMHLNVLRQADNEHSTKNTTSHAT